MPTTAPDSISVLFVACAEPDRHSASFNRIGLRLVSLPDMRSLVSQADRIEAGAIVLWVEDLASALDAEIPEAIQAAPEVPIVVVCDKPARWSARAALTAGVAGIVQSQRATNALAACVSSVLAGQICVPREHSRQIDPPALSAREKQILGLVVMGYMNGQIAERLYLAESTVKSHLSSAFGKLGVRSRNEAVSLILDPERGLGMGILALVNEHAPVAAERLSV